jgi:hypothetical protein
MSVSFLDGKPGHYQFDIEGYVAARLAQRRNSAQIECLGEDTYLASPTASSAIAAAATEGRAGLWPPDCR